MAPVSVSNHSHSSNKVMFNYANNNCNYSTKSIYCAIDTAISDCELSFQTHRYQNRWGTVYRDDIIAKKTKTFQELKQNTCDFSKLKANELIIYLEYNHIL